MRKKKAGIEISRFTLPGEKELISKERAQSLAREEASVLIKEGVGALRNIVSEHNLIVNKQGKEAAERAIEIGTRALELRPAVKKLGVRWSTWADENLSFIGKRNLQKYVRLARRKDCYPYTDLGIERLDALCAATEALEGEDPIGSIFKGNIPLNKRAEVDVGEFKVMVNTAVNNDKLQKKGLEVELVLIEKLTRQGVRFDTSFLEKLVSIKESGDDSETFLQNLAMAGGKEETLATAEERLRNFITLADKLTKAADDILKEPEQISKIDRGAFVNLLRKLTELQSAGNIVLNQDEAANHV